MFTVDWEQLFIPSGSLVEIFLRGTLMYLVLYMLLRFILKRESGMVNTSDLLVVVLLADAAQNGMANQYESITEGIVLTATILGWSFVLETLSFHFEPLRRLIKPQPLLLVKNGRMLMHNLRKELLTRDELMSNLRKQGVEHLSEVKEAYMEEDGQISAITLEGFTGQQGPNRKGL